MKENTYQCKKLKLKQRIKGFLFINNRYYNSIYHKVSRDEAEKKLHQANTQAGTFLIRESESNPGQHYVLSFNDGVTIRHYCIHTEFNKYYIHLHIQFDSLNDLVHHYMMKADHLVCSLTVPIPKQVNIPIAMSKEWEINKSHIKFSKCINARQFGERWEGNWKGRGSVMIKTNIATDITQKTFLEEANILKKFYHKNIISLYGVCIESYPFYIVTEPINRNLRNHVHMNKPTPAELVDIAIQVVDGMIYLGEQDYIHCNLRAENILLRDRHNTVKIANFHLAQHLNGNKYWTVKKGTMLAYKWTAPEGYTLNRLSIKSDVWSFGVLLRELATKGKEPHPGMTNAQVAEAVLKGDRMSIPKDCPEPFDQLMISCWRYNDDERPSFKDIFDVFITYDTHDT